MADTLIVSNRLPFTVQRTADGKLEYVQSSGGLATGLSSVGGQSNVAWIGWPGIPSDDITEQEKADITTELGIHHCYPVFLTRKQIDSFYNGFSNSILWPLFHELPFVLKNHTSLWQSYKAVNKQFARAVLGRATTKSTIWVHDYQLLLLPELIRQGIPQATTGFFLHIPFPSLASLRQLPSADELISGMLGAKLVGFHTDDYSDNFLNSCSKLGIGSRSSDHITHKGHTTRVGAFPMGIDYSKFRRAATSRTVKQELKRLKKLYKNKKIILTVDRLDPTKGFVERLEAYRDFLTANTAHHGKVVMLMLAVPSRLDIDVYKALKEEVERIVQEINDTFQTPKWQPVHYMFQSTPFEKLSALYQRADIAFVAPIRDGMNLVAKEFVASKPKQDGVLILSETAGAAKELKDALMVNPAQRHTLVDAITRAVTMPKKELRGRLSTMQAYLSDHTVQDWAQNFMDVLTLTTVPTALRTRRLTQKVVATLTQDYQHAQRKLLILDYDGTLREFAKNPSLAGPSPRLLSQLEALGRVPGNEVVLVSGRSRKNMEEWFGELPISLVAEQGAAVRRHRSWKKSDVNVDWKAKIKPALEKYARRTPGAFVEEKDTALVWHYRESNTLLARHNAAYFRRRLSVWAKKYQLSVYRGKKIIELRPKTISKDLALRPWLETSSWDFILAIGDDDTDEDVFAALPPSAYTVKVRYGRTLAKFRLTSIRSVHKFLDNLS